MNMAKRVKTRLCTCILPFPASPEAGKLILYESVEVGYGRLTFISPGLGDKSLISPNKLSELPVYDLIM